MPFITQKRIYRSDLRANPHAIYLFGDNVKRAGMGGQAAEMRYERNAIGVATKWEPTSNPEAYFTDADYNRCIGVIDEDLRPAFDRARGGRIIVVPADGLGTGLSQLPRYAPKVLAYLNQQLVNLQRVAS